MIMKNNELKNNNDNKKIAYNDNTSNAGKKPRTKFGAFITNAFNTEAEHGLFYISIPFLLALIIGFILLYILITKYNLGHLFECNMLKLTGIPCPACGGTRATINFFQGHFIKAIYYHAFAVYIIIMYSVFFVTHLLQDITKNRIHGLKIHNWMWITALVLLIGQYILKLAISDYLL